MKKLTTSFVFFFLCAFSEIIAQTPAIEFKLQLLPDGESWGVFAKPKQGISPSTMTITGSAQVTVVMPVGFQWGNLKNHAGTWNNDATASAPIENPSRVYTSFGLITDSPKIIYAANTETLLFSFEKISSCPDSLYLIDNINDPFNHLPNSCSSNPGNEISVIDFGISGFPIYDYLKNFATSAWNCHDCNNNGLPNALDSIACPLEKCVLLKLQYKPANPLWAVKLKAKPGSIFTKNNIVSAGSITLVAPQSFEYHSFTSIKGVWELTSTLENPAENPGMKYLTFELKHDTIACNLLPWVETTLFTFKSSGDCPDSLYLMFGMTPSGVKNTKIEGEGEAFGQTYQLKLCGIADPAAWNCFIAPPSDQESLYKDFQHKFSENPEVDNRPVHFEHKNKIEHHDWLNISPNPSSDWLNVSCKNKQPQANRVLRLLNLQGQLILVENLGNENNRRLDLSAFQPGLYLLTLEIDGKVVEREKVVKH